MQALTYYITLPFIYLLSILPFRVMYWIADFLYFVFYYVLGYRKDVVLQNLRNSFPDKNEAELERIRKAFFHHLSDMFLETFKTLTISPKKMLQHCGISPEAKALFDKLANDQKNIILVMGHLGNWEWGGNTFSLTCLQPLYVIYHPLRNKHFDEMMYKMRTRFGTQLIAMRNTYKEMLGRKTPMSATAFIADQTPQPDNAYWTTFLNQDTPVFKGTEIIARKTGSPIVYASVRKIKRGYYELHAEMLLENPTNTPDGYISELHTKRLEQDIIAYPETWLWSHKRWKHKRPTKLQ